MQRVYDGRCVRLVIDPHGHLWLDYGEGEVSSVPFTYDHGRHAIVLPLSCVHDLGPEAYGQFTIDAAEQGIAVLPEVTAAARAEWRLEQQQQERES